MPVASYSQCSTELPKRRKHNKSEVADCVYSLQVVDAVYPETCRWGMVLGGTWRGDILRIWVAIVATWLHEMVVCDVLW